MKLRENEVVTQTDETPCTVSPSVLRCGLVAMRVEPEDVEPELAVGEGYTRRHLFLYN